MGTQKEKGEFKKMYILKRNFIRESERKEFFETFKKLPELAPKEFVMFKKTIQTPRRMGYYADTQTLYGYGKKQLPDGKLTTEMKILLAQVNEEFGTKFNICLVNHYRSGKDYISFHRDREAKDGPVAGVSFGVTRKMSFRDRNKKHVETFDFNDGDLVFMKAGCQQKLKHSILKEAKKTGERVSLTFREFY